ncbi:MAG: SDR family NAD(P)-dependent oxidoreductase [Actinobacteria bacterium]|uniref:Dehydrogenase n=1 Tax=Nostocoides veronense TaxID=330836 RepID=A0ABP4XJY6_9MICO|nr:SDR family NAD(P)-dependent oxidoreductase [Actinomycetota bacterium]
MTSRSIRSAAASALDAALDRTVVPGFSRIGPAVRSRLSTWPADPEPATLIGRQVLVTGASSGIGTAVAEQLAALGATVHLLVRDRAKGQAVADRLPHDARVWTADLADLESVRAAATALRDSGIELHGIVHNAGVLPAKRTESAQGHELTMAVHVLGPVLLTDLLADRLAPDSRIVFVTSGGMYTQPLPVDDPEYQSEKFSGATAYARSKRTQVDLLDHFVRRWPAAHVYAMHPGWVTTPGVTESLPGFDKVMGPLLRQPDDGADTITWLLATMPAPPGGGLWHDRHERSTNFLPTTRSTPADRDRLWTWVLENSGLTMNSTDSRNPS